MTRTQFYYKNHRGVTELRTIEPVSLQYVASPHLEYGYAPGWFLHGLDFTERDGVARKGEPRSFSLDHIQMEGFKYGTKGGAAAFHLMLQPSFVPVEREERNEHAADSLAYAMTAAVPVDEPTGGEAQGLVITGRLRNAIKGPWYPGSPDVLNGESYGHTRFHDGMPIHTSTIVEDLGPTKKGGHLFKTKSGSIYLVESWLPGHAPK